MVQRKTFNWVSGCAGAMAALMIVLAGPARANHVTEAQILICQGFVQNVLDDLSATTSLQNRHQQALARKLDSALGKLGLAADKSGQTAAAKPKKHQDIIDKIDAALGAMEAFEDKIDTLFAKNQIGTTDKDQLLFGDDRTDGAILEDGGSDTVIDCLVTNLGAVSP